MSATKSIVIPLSESGYVYTALNFGRRAAKTHNAILQLLCRAEPGEPPEKLIERFGLTPELLFNAVVNPVCCSEKDYEAAILQAAARPEVEMLIFSDTGSDSQLMQAVIEHAPCPVLLVRPELSRLAEKPVKQILVPLDSTPSSAVAIEPAVRIAAEAEAELHVLHIVTVGETADEPGSLPIGPYMDQPQYEWPLWIREFWDRFIVCVKEIAPQVVPQLHVARGQIEREIMRFVQKIDCSLVTMAAGTDFRLVNTLASTLSCPVLVVRQGKEFCKSVRRTAA